MRKYILFLIIVFSVQLSQASYLLIPMDETQTDHLKAYGITYWVLQNELEVQWLLNYRGGSFLIQHHVKIQNECNIRGVSYEVITDAKAAQILDEISHPDVNMDVVKLQKAAKIAVYAPPNKLPWDDAVMLVLTYAEIPYDLIYDEQIIRSELSKYDWLHLHHEDFTGQFGKFWSAYQNTQWYRDDVERQMETAQKFGFQKVSQLKLLVAKTIKQYVFNGGFLFAMCSATDTYDIALAAESTDICETPFDGDPADPNAQAKLNYDNCLAFRNFKVITNPYEYEHSDIDVSHTRKIKQEDDYFTLFDFSAKWDPVPTMLCQNHENLIKGFMGQSTAFKKDYVKPNVLIMGENKALNEVRYLYGIHGKGFFTFYGGHDPEDYQHFVYDPPTKLELYKNSAGYRLILNNVLFPSAKKKKLKT
ncbi:MAG: asparagine synthetase B [Bacteroidales bacterium]|nr:asparagine synthetase B [Bacteroidales bacterium]